MRPKALLPNLSFLLILLLAYSCQNSASKMPGEAKAPISDTVYNDSVAKALKADSFGMKHYVLVLLYEGSRRDQDSATVAQIQKAHLKNILRLAREGKLLMAGPCLDDSALRGIFIFNVGTVDEASALVATDPAIQSGRLRAEMHPWYGPATLQRIVPLQRQVQKKSFTD